MAPADHRARPPDPPSRPRTGFARFPVWRPRPPRPPDSCLPSRFPGRSALSSSPSRFVSRAWFPWVAWLSLPPLFLAIRALRPVRAMVVGFTWGQGFSLFASLRSQLLLTATPTMLIYPAFIAATCTLSDELLTARLGFQPVLLALGSVGVEVALGPIGLPRGLLAAGQWD